MLKLALAVTLSLVSTVIVAQTSATTTVTPLPAIEADLDRFLIAYQNDGLRLFALMVRPKKATGPLPVVIANHGFHPNPPRYGFVDDDRNERPGKYYGAVPIAFARHGYAVVMADYRGHNTSQGLEFTRMPAAPDLYASDVHALFKTLKAIEGLRRDCWYAWGHSMGAHVSLRLMLAEPEIQAVSLWSLATPLADWTGALRAAKQRPAIIVRHATADPVAPVAASRKLAESLLAEGYRTETAFEDSPLHFFEQALFDRSIDDDVRYFNQHGTAACAAHAVPRQR